MMGKKTLVKRIVLTVVVLFVGIIISMIIYDRATINKEYGIYEKNIQIPVFVYHDIVNEESEIKFDYMQTTEETFEKQILGLKNMGYDFISYEDLQKYKNNQKKLKKHSCVVTFDDGYEGVYENAYPIAKKYNIPIVMYVITDNIGMDGVITWEQAKEMQDSGLVTIASHSTNHPEFTSLSTKEAVENVNKSYELIEQNLGSQKTKIFTYPYGLYTDEQIEALQAEGYIQNLTDNKINKSKDLDLARLHRCYPLSDSPAKMILKIIYRSIRYN
ncbi:MAG: polysaccharide deacetylase family protein [Clostridia bacterium]|nr:polysaccharide deacetylase family protein [Clostridia bacterium]